MCRWDWLEIRQLVSQISLRLKVVLEAKVTFFKSVYFKAAWSLSQNKFVYKFSFQGNLYLARYERLKFQLQGKFCGKIATEDGSNCNCGLPKHSLWYANLTVCSLQSRLRTLSQVTDSLLNTPYSCSFKWKISSYVSLMKENCILVIEGYWNVFFAWRRSNAIFVMWHRQYQPLSAVIEHNFILQVAETATLSTEKYNAISMNFCRSFVSS